jgi:hypothetical protein
MAALDTVQNYIDRSRTLLNDTVAPYRYPDADLVEALNMGVLEARRIRPDLFRTFFRATDGLPEFSTGDLAEEVDIDAQYRVTFVYYIVGQIQLRDEEDVQDTRAAAFLNKFNSQLLAVQA